MIGTQTQQKPVREYRLSGLYRLKNGVNKLGTRLIDRRYKVGRELAKWQADLVADLGGEVALSTQQRVIVDLCVRSKLLIDSIDVWLLSQKSLVNARKRTLIGVVKERQGIADGLTRNLQLLGLKRVERTVDWRDALRESPGTEGNQQDSRDSLPLKTGETGESSEGQLEVF